MQDLSITEECLFLLGSGQILTWFIDRLALLGITSRVMSGKQRDKDDWNNEVGHPGNEKPD